MNISYYTAFFHDGSIINIQHKKNVIKFYMASAEMDEEDIKDDLKLSYDDSIRGILHIEEVESITINGEIFLGKLNMNYENGRIFDFEITDKSVEFSIDWVDFPPKPEVNEFSVIQIEAKKIWWENIPDLKDSLR
jgi:hypothetical protein